MSISCKILITIDRIYAIIFLIKSNLSIAFLFLEKRFTMKKINIGILAHVDAGKTTLSEALLYQCGAIKDMGRVDHGNAVLDFDNMERKRGITIYSKEVSTNYRELSITLVDTPGHLDFSCEMERTLQVLDMAIVVISGTDGLQSHHETIFKLLDHYQVPAMLFINKMDISYLSKDEIVEQIQHKCNLEVIDFSLEKDKLLESIAVIEDSLLEKYLETNKIDDQDIQLLVQQRKIVPCFNGSALKNKGIEELLEGIYRYHPTIEYSKEFGARVYKISFDEFGNRLTHLKITGGCLENKTVLFEGNKVDQIRIYQANKYEMVQSVQAGTICVVKGIPNLQAGYGLGFENNRQEVYLTSYMNYQIILPKDVDSFEVFPKLQRLQIIDPQLKLTYDQQQTLSIHAMGEVQLEVVKQTIKDLFLMDVQFMPGQIIYKETIRNGIIGVGHFEPLRHYSEVQLYVEPNEFGKGIEINSVVHQDDLSMAYQNYIIKILKENTIPGVLTAGELTDLKITLIAGKAHLKHTEGGDFYEATIRALRNALYLGDSILLEPYQNITISSPNHYLSKIMFDLDNKQATYTMSVDTNGNTVFNGIAPVQYFQDYPTYIQSTFKGEVEYQSSFYGYKEVINQSNLIQEQSYDALADTNFPCGSIFCSHGAGFYVAPEKVCDYQHIVTNYKKETKSSHYTKMTSSDWDLETIFERTYGKVETKLFEETKKTPSIVPSNTVKSKPIFMFVDAYNVIHAWQKTKDVIFDSVEDARDILIEMLCDYQGYRNIRICAVFDAYKVKEGRGSINKYSNIEVAFTKEGQTADMYIERNMTQFLDEYQIIVVSSDGLVQTISLAKGARRMSSRELVLEYQHFKKSNATKIISK